MSQPLVFPQNHYESLPHIRISKKRYLVIENNFLYLVKLHSDQSIFTQLFLCSEIQKFVVQMQRSKNGSYLQLSILPRTGKKKGFFIRPRKFGYSPIDWMQIPEFLNIIGFKSELLPSNKKRLEDIQKAWEVRGPYRYFSSEDKIFDLFENLEFVEELKMIRLNPLGIVLTTLGACCLIPAIIFGFIPLSTPNYLFWIFSGITLPFLGIGISKINLFIKKKKKFAKKYDIEYYF
ncbi:hypothetical protein [Candidatus Lokiarchaeum ossiferum]|uniref:hypothetical protein n=1 Tax=Candidatus Lokiarchaeum ossiferum TaxID=2951803 RepID=UPI00352EE9B7